MKKILYIGGFEMPDKNAAAQRVLSVAKALRETGYETLFYGITTTGETSGDVEGFHYEACLYPKGKKAWFKYALGNNGILDYIKLKRPDFVFLYNYPAFAQEKVVAYCRLHEIKTVGDITEWYRPTSLPKRIDTFYRMRIGNKHLDGLITISKFLTEYYKVRNHIQLPPLVDKQEEKWKISPIERMNEKINLVYIGTGSVKDRLDKILKGVCQAGKDKFHIDIIGITAKQFSIIYRQQVPDSFDLHFYGRLPHNEALKYLMSADFQIFFRDYIRVNNAGFPTKFVESMSAGIPVITNKISNIDDYIKNGENSFMIDNPGEKEICDVLKMVSNLTKEEIKTIKRNCLKDEFDYRKYVELLSTFMDSL